MAKMTKRTMPKKVSLINPDCSELAATETSTVPVPTTEPEVDPEEKHYRKNPLPPNKLTLVCTGCQKERTMYVKSLDEYDDAAVAQMFSKHSGSVDPVLCGFCFRQAQFKATGKRIPFLEPADRKPKAPRPEPEPEVIAA